MTCRFQALLITCTGFALAASLGAGPATQPTDVRRDKVALMPKAKAAELKLDVRFLQKPLETIPSARVYVPRMPDAGRAMPRAQTYVTPRSSWIPKLFNGQTFYIIPCETGAAPTASVPVPVDVGTLVTPTTPAAVPPAQPIR